MRPTCFANDGSTRKRGRSTKRRTSTWLLLGVPTLFAALAALVTPTARASCATGAPPASLRSVAFFYGSAVPVEQLARFDAVVLEPDAPFDPVANASTGPTWYAYVSVGEVTTDRAYFPSIPKQWLAGRNAVWKGAVIDQSAPGWPEFFVERIIAPLWARGYRGFFLDTLDSYQLIAKTDAERAQQLAGLVASIRAIKARYPDARLILNRGFEILPEVHDAVTAVAFESLFGSWDQRHQRYAGVPPGDREWLLAQATTIRTRYNLPIISIDYCAPGDTQCQREIVHKVCDLGIVPYVTDGALQTVGEGPEH
jgi:hypothetical protein